MHAAYFTVCRMYANHAINSYSLFSGQLFPFSSYPLKSSMLSFLEVSRYFQFVSRENPTKHQMNSTDSAESSSFNASSGFRSRFGSDASTLTISSQAELQGRITKPEYPVVAVKWSSRGLIAMALVHTSILFVDIFLLNTTDSRRWRNENVQAYALFSLLIFLTNFSLPLVITAVLFKQSKALTLFASFSVFWTSFAYGVIIMAYSEFDNPISSQPAGSLTMLTLLLTMLDCLALVVYFFTRFIRYKTFAGLFTPKINLIKAARNEEPSRKFGLILPMTVDESETESKSSFNSEEEDTLTSIASSVAPPPIKFMRQRSRIHPPINYI
ncbi:hypothetical protein PMAYCL1PPCAC_01858 [Pristionchus mayeri]|uniref:Uncharacterized protein n=1 Tax=Pristionchus mayeri TaxID=1317129 RepID=A0AAN4Z4B6_9BILA|nr:hypothetical protein PMAYCL1PPCAC_01858 [Pristionchus mayeri]